MTGQALQRMIGHFKGRPEVSALYVFGARGAPGSERHEACLGVLLEDPPRGAGGHEIVMEECCPAFDPDSGEVVLMNLAEPYVKYHIVRKGSVVFEKSPGHRIRFTEKAVREFYDCYALAGAVRAEEGFDLICEGKCVEPDC